VAVEQAFQIPGEFVLILGLLFVGWVMDQRDRRYAAQWQLVLDRTHHGSPLKPYDWELEN
jgi:hypothetical protein|tara:strand:- start:23 stop:202 length:180 start_codon:yes stop_codon:yes gene_type:complete